MGHRAAVAEQEVAFRLIREGLEKLGKATMGEVAVAPVVQSG